MRKFYTTKEIATKQGVTPRTVRNWIKAGNLVAQRTGRDWIVFAEDYERFKRKQE